jgi:hypothetical protein
MKFFEKIDGLKREEREKELGAYRPQAQEKLVTVLKETMKEDQRKRLRQLELQQEGPFALKFVNMRVFPSCRSRSRGPPDSWVATS